ncbi:MAG: hypothetical protein AVDCRST_MAG86-942 [uncultured Truepera sp.]|uniref:Pyrrolo-quinoline quinone repeat domain-containing protein n=1 Tax=uncultured Truepera sp. TaxID=543023 RepID=A0A6J4UXG7_9DEIN|nr:MAG: hypothetical protein AVDCRST_MAG86-942 [uncultured Truepera sp.]
MKRTCLAVAVALLLVACSQTPEEAAPDLSPQFGTPGTYSAVDQLAVGESGVYLGGTWKDKPSLIKFSRSGNIPWVRSLSGQVFEVALDSGGSAYVLFHSSANDAEYFLRKYTQTGTFVWQRQFTVPDGDGSGYYASDVDAQNSLYLSYAGFDASDKKELRKYRSDGTLLYSKPLAEGITDLAVVPDGTTYTVSSKQRLTRYTSQGAQVWQKTLPFAASRVAVGSNSQVYVAGQPVFDNYITENRVLLARYNSSGAKYWQRTVRTGFFAYGGGLDADTEGNVFVSVNDQESPRDDRDVYFYSYNAAGTRLVQRTFDFDYDAKLAELGALNATEVYLGGTDDSSYEEGFLVRLNGLTGSVTWQR